MRSVKLQERLSKSDIRRRQVIEAAADCFRQDGFHGTSIARISKASGMSAGHIYHYFDTKEQIVEALIEQEESDLAELLQFLKQDESFDDFREAVARQIEGMLERILDPSRVALMLEIAAEAGRNPRVALILQRSDERIAWQFAALAKAKGDPAFADLDDPDIRARMEILPLFLAGMAHRSLFNPGLDRRRLVGMIKTILTTIWREERDG